MRMGTDASDNSRWTDGILQVRLRSVSCAGRITFRGTSMRAVSAVLLLTVLSTALPVRAAILGEPSGTGALPAVAEGIADLPRHTVYRPLKMPKKALPLFVWGNGACRDNGLAYGAFLRQIASHGYFVISVGVPRAERPPEPATPAAPAAPASPAAPAAPAPVRNTPDET